jgi:hypothetical protein
MPIAIPVFEKDPVQLIIISRVRSAQIDCHTLGRIRVNEKAMHTACLDRDLPICWSYATGDPVYFDSEHAILHTKVLGLKLMKMRRRALRSIGTVDELAQIFRDWAFNSVAVCLTEEKATTCWRLQEFSG